MQQLAPSQASPEVPINENFDTLSWAAVYGKRQAASVSLTWGYYGGRWGGFSVADGTLTMTDAATNYVVAARSSGALSVSTSTTNWNDSADYARVYIVTTSGGVVTAVQDHRGGDLGLFSSAAGGTSGLQSIVTTATNSAALALTPADHDVYQRLTGTGTKTVEFDSAESFSAGNIFHIANRGASGIVDLFGTGVTLNPPKGGSLTLEPDDTVSVLFVSSTEADVYGSTEAAT